MDLPVKTYDAIIVGAGPAGSMAGYTLAQAGLEVLLLEKSVFPRLKVCGGGLMVRARNLIPFDISPVFHNTVRWGYVQSRGHMVKPIAHTAPIAYLIDRPEFDNFLLQQALEQGVDCRMGEGFIAYQQNADKIQVRTAQDVYHSRCLIGADGVHSRVATQAGLIKKRFTSLSYEAHLAYPKSLKDPRLETITFDFGAVPFGYGWIFPKHDHLNVGVFRSWPGRKTTRQQLLRFIDNHPVLSRTSIKNMRAFPGSLGINSTVYQQGNVLLAGDAASLVDPWLGEGLTPALLSGKIAAETLIRFFDGAIPDLTAYSRTINSEIASQFTYAKRLSLLINAFPGFSVRLLQSSATLQMLIIDLLTGKRTYHDVYRSIFRLLPSKINGLFHTKKHD